MQVHLPQSSSSLASGQSGTKLHSASLETHVPSPHVKFDPHRLGVVVGGGPVGRVAAGQE